MEDGWVSINPESTGGRTASPIHPTAGEPIQIKQMLECIDKCEGAKLFPKAARSKSKKKARREAITINEFRANNCHKAAWLGVATHQFEIGNWIGNMFDCIK